MKPYTYAPWLSVSASFFALCGFVASYGNDLAVGTVFLSVAILLLITAITLHIVGRKKGAV